MEEVDSDGNGEGYSGTFRWKRSKQLPSMPSFTALNSNLNLSRGWMEYFKSRQNTPELSKQLIQKAQQDLSLIDCLSTPLTISYLCHHYFSSHPISDSSSTNLLNIVCIGAAQKAEGRVLLETNCFSEISYNLPYFTQINLYLVGPEMESSSSPIQLTSNLTASLFQGTSIEFFRSHSFLLSQQTIVIGLNCGYGNWENPLPRRYELTFQWLPDLYFLTGLKLPLYFTCANDYADLIGEVALHQLICGSYFLLPPQENQFSYASTFISSTTTTPSSTTRSEGEYSRGNSFIYGIQGSNKLRRKIIASGDVNGLQLALRASKMVPCDELPPPSSVEIKKTEAVIPTPAPTTPPTTATATTTSSPPPPQPLSPSPPISTSNQSDQSSQDLSTNTSFNQTEPPPSSSSSPSTAIFTIHRSLLTQSSPPRLQIELQLFPEVNIRDVDLSLSPSHEFFRIIHPYGQENSQIFDIPFNYFIHASTLKTKYSRSKHKLIVNIEIELSETDDLEII